MCIILAITSIHLTFLFHMVPSSFIFHRSNICCGFFFLNNYFTILQLCWFCTTPLNSYSRLIPPLWSYLLLHVHGIFRDRFVVSESDLNLVGKKYIVLCFLLVTLPSSAFTRVFFFILIQYYWIFLCCVEER